MKLFLLALASFFVCGLHAQTAVLKGSVTDNVTKKPVVGAKIIFSEKYRVYSDSDGNFEIKNVDYGTYNGTVTMLSFDTLFVKVVVNAPVVVSNIILGSKELDEVSVIGNLAKERETPVAQTTMTAKEIQEELGSQDLPMVLNSKPGVHATQQGGGDGDARITIRGFDQRNVGVLIDGVPVNDMESGAVYWSNWFGLDAITSQIQIQRGLGATKLAMPSVGGTMNILTRNTGGKREISVLQEYGSGTFLRTSFAYKSGTLKNGWGFLFSGSYKQGNGWVDGLFTQGGFYYGKVQKRIGNHVISLSGFGAPQQHGQRSYNQKIEYWDSEYAQSLGVTVFDSARMDNGIRYNEHWGYVTNENGERVQKSERRNFYHKPQLTLKDFWKVNEKLSWSNIAYVSIGRGGGERYFNSGSTMVRDENGLVDWDQIIKNNQVKVFGGQEYPTTDALYDPNLLKSSQVMSAAMNNHLWIGGISQFDYQLSQYWKIAGGLDYRWYKGEHFVELTDILGGDYFVNAANQNAATPMKVVGDKIARLPYQNHRDGFVQWAGGFGQVEYSKGQWNAFVNVSTVTNGYRGVDYFNKQQLDIGDTTLLIGYGDTVTYNGQSYDQSSEGVHYDETGWTWRLGGTFKAGANFNVTEKSNIFLNVGYLDRTPQFSNVIDNNTNEFFAEILNEKIIAFELGYGYKSKKFSINTNAYYTVWKNKPFPFGVLVPDPLDPTEFIRANVNGMDALHMGVEVDAVYDISKKLSVEGMVSIGDWTWQSSEQVDVLGTIYEFDAKGVHVGDAAQSTYAASVRYQFVKNGYIKVKYTFFDRYYSNFDPFSLTGANGGTESWRIPSYGLMSIHAGYRFKFDNSSLNLRGNVFNALNTLYISDARTNQYGTDFSVNSVGVFVGQGLQFNVALGFEF